MTFATFDSFDGFKEFTRDIVCGHAGPDTTPASVAHKMPAAEQTLKVL